MNLTASWLPAESYDRYFRDALEGRERLTWVAQIGANAAKTTSCTFDSNEHKRLTL